MALPQWRLDTSGDVDGWLVIQGTTTRYHQPAIRDAFAQGYVVDGAAAPRFGDKDFVSASQYPVLRIFDSLDDPAEDAALPA